MVDFMFTINIINDMEIIYRDIKLDNFIINEDKIKNFFYLKNLYKEIIL
jgi:hypothetical protein